MEYPLDDGTLFAETGTSTTATATALVTESVVAGTDVTVNLFGVEG